MRRNLTWSSCGPPDIVAVRVGGVSGVVFAAGDTVCGRVWTGGRSIGVGSMPASGERVDVVDQRDEAEHGDQ